MGQFHIFCGQVLKVFLPHHTIITLDITLLNENVHEKDNYFAEKINQILLLLNILLNIFYFKHTSYSSESSTFR